MALRLFSSTKWHIAKSGDGEAHTANQVAYQPPAGMASVTVQEALDELRVLIGQAFGTDSAPSFYRHVQPVAATSWTINHGLGFRPNVGIFTDGGEEMDGSIQHTTANQVLVRFVRPVAGEAFLS